jgi:multiple sugar transport system permease protein
MADKSGFFERNLKYIFPFPAIVVLVLLVIVPVCYTLYISFTAPAPSSGGPVRFEGFNNYLELLKNARFNAAVIRTLIFTFGVVAAEAVLGTFIAIVLHRKFRGKGLLKSILLLPLAAAPSVIGIVWKLFYNPDAGLFNYLLDKFGLPHGAWFSDPATALLSLMLVDVWQWTPMIALIVLAGLSGLPKEPSESAKLDGAGSARVFFHITLPMIMPAILAAIVLRAVDALKTYDIIYVMTMGGPGHSTETLNILAYKLSFEYFDPGQSSALLLVFFLVVLFFSPAIMQLRKKYEA